MELFAIAKKAASSCKAPRELFLSALFLACGLAFLAGAAGGGQAGQEDSSHMILSGGSQGVVPFPHGLHQKVVEDCQTCHALFEQQKGAIEKAQKAGELGNRELMRQCTTCHRQARQAKQPHGPVSCNNCHNA
ncbi:MAG: cytochrome c3 family protein [Desulfatibacillaceae bacterium]|nr:cytochrome c3 family protein [Desulfatibacillaceae bacterium]